MKVILEGGQNEEIKSKASCAKNIASVTIITIKSHCKTYIVLTTLLYTFIPFRSVQ